MQYPRIIDDLHTMLSKTVKLISTHLK